ncbi:response regulator [Halobacteriovorax sp. GB3]|uniref:response regulator n=1 Tax=Halobacteriovorax sp. GB3 TaxID=2719615 RepID=UPI0023621C14|nr:response regulator [Halobacteriovorax sp. GB3]MDD0854447.1 response regulator [Halobacteriovorax sp. GB3]
MTTKVLVADDSQTIQKVVKITLADTNYEITPVLDGESFRNAVKSDAFDLILLDFSLEGSQSGYELATFAHTHIPNVAVMAMLGTFDSINDQKMNDCGIAEKITKPFESEKFIRKCQELIESDRPLAEVNLDRTAEHSLPEEFSESSEPELGDDWVLDSPEVEDHSFDDEEDFQDSSASENMLMEEAKGWGIEVPNVINTQMSLGEMPPVIDGQNNVTNLHVVEEESFESSLEEEVDDAFEALSAEPVEEEEVVLPSNDDLDYPDMDADVDYIGSSEEDLKSVSYPGAVQEDEEEVFEASDESDEELEMNIESELDEDATDPSYQIPKEFARDLQTVSEGDSIPSEDAEQFWSIDDDNENLKNLELKTEVKGNQLNSAVSDIPEKAESQEYREFQFDEDKIVERITNNLKPMIEELIKEACKSKVEEVTWEVIPDLAENLIRKEIKDISSTVMNESIK